METQQTIVREYATGMVDGFFNDLIAGVIPRPVGQDALINAFIDYVTAAR